MRPHLLLLLVCSSFFLLSCREIRALTAAVGGSASSLSSRITTMRRPFFLAAATEGEKTSSPAADAAGTEGEDSTERHSGGSSRKPVPGDVVTINCRLKPEGEFVPNILFDGVVMHDEEPAQRLTFVLGGGNYLPGLHDVVQDMQVGDILEQISLDAGWGARNPDLVATLTYEAAGIGNPDQIQINTELLLQNGLKCVVTERNDESFTIDANPPLAGASYLATVELLKVEAGPKPIPFSATTSSDNASSSHYEVATVGLGCFWGAELEFMRLPGVVGTSVGYTQGQVEHPTYQQVCTGTTGHTEAVLVTYDPNRLPYEKLVHTAMDRLGENRYLLNQVGNDKGTQYRHGIYYHNDEQRKVAEQVIAQYGEDCMTECKPATEWYPAEDYHQQYLLKGGQSARKSDKTAIRCYG